MKKALLSLLLCTASLCFAQNASANQWGLPGGPLLDFVLETHDYDAYPYVFYDADNPNATLAAIFSNTKNSQLVILKSDNGRLVQLGRYPAAVFQPSGDAIRWDVQCLENDGFSMTLPNGDSYAFTWDGFDVWNGQKQLTLHSARIGNLTFSAAGEEYSVTCDGECVTWQTDGPIMLRDFCIDMMPQSLDEIRQRNATAARLSSMHTWWGYTQIDLDQKKTLPVYAAPSEKAWRGAKGKAAVGLSAPFTRLASVTENGEHWWLIEYDVSFSEKRIGYIQKPADVGVSSGVWFEEQAVSLADGTAMTDDPHAGRRAIATLGTDTQATSLGYVDAFWCYVQTKIDGKTARGFVPLRDVVLPEQQRLRQIEESLVGTWRFAGGGELCGDGFVIGPDGVFMPCEADDTDSFPPQHLALTGETLSFAVFADAPTAMEGAFALEIYDGKGRVSRYLLTFERETGTLLLAQGEAGGFYERVVVSDSWSVVSD